jgi:broad-specificity NMP kinase
MNDKKIKTLYLIGGTMGVGKTTVCQRLKMDLPNSVFLDGDWCWDANPFQVTEETKTMVLDNICYLLNSFLRCSAYEHIILGWVMYEQSIIDHIIGNLNMENCAVRSISLVANEACLRERLLKDVAQGRRTVDVIERSVSRLPLYRQLNTVKVDTSNKSVQQIVDEIKAIR